MDLRQGTGNGRRAGGGANKARAGGPGRVLTVVVADASALLEYLLRTERSSSIEEIVRREDSDLHVPALCDVEVVAGLRRSLRRDLLTLERAQEAVIGYRMLPLTRHGHQMLMNRILELRENFTVYDATYVALGERLGATLLTADIALARAVSAHTDLAAIAAATSS